MGVTAYDNVKKQYQSTWMDTMSTGILDGEGTYNPKTKTIAEKGEYTCPIEKDHEAEYRSEWKIIDKDNTVFSMYGKGPNGKKEFKMMEMTYKRAI